MIRRNVLFAHNRLRGLNCFERFFLRIHQNWISAIISEFRLQAVRGGNAFYYLLHPGLNHVLDRTAQGTAGSFDIGRLGYDIGVGPGMELRHADHGSLDGLADRETTR